MAAIQSSDPIAPQLGPQMQFAATRADIALFGGAAGPGKSYMLVLEPLRHVHKPGFTGAIFRRTSPELTGPGSVWEEASFLYPHLGGMMREHKMDARFPSGALIQFAHCQYEQDLIKHQSKAYCYLGVDELAEFSERQFWFLLGRNRTARDCAVRPYFRAATNPDADSFARSLVDWWIDSQGYPIPERSGVIRWLARVDEEIVWSDTKQELEQQMIDAFEDPQDRPEPKSFTFVAAKLEDNPLMTRRDPGYRANLNLLPRLDRMRFLGGNWNVRAAAGVLFQSQWFEVIPATPASVVCRVRAWDKAGTEKKKGNDPSWTVGALWAKTSSGLFVVEHIVRLQGNPMEVENAITNTATADGKGVDIAIWQDPGQAGKADVDHFIRLLPGYTVRGYPAREDKVTYAKPVSAQAERGNVKLLRGPWNRAWLDEHENFPDQKAKDQVDTSSLALLHLTGGWAVPRVGPATNLERE